ncbi:INO80 complex, subunit Ies4 [Calycina marina]|uniref:INO80 complex, subunit Ies4 n=1 Tax=Calycina marina TaxID=1763456 RepID=A0A9P8CIR1_9HELO|nr:INO80 complex, subunit Ies4 [Calycina marina]
MASPSATKTATATPAKRKSSNLKQEIKPSQIVTLKLSPESLRQFSAPEIQKTVKEESAAKESPTNTPATEPSPAIVDAAKASPDATTNPLLANGTPLPSSSMPPPPTESVKKKGLKRAAPVIGPDGNKIRGKPGPKKRPRLEDGSIDHSGTTPRAAPGTAAHKLGPKANQGAINANMRALDRTGKPCRKWQKGSFKIKSFTGAIWELPRWKAPPKPVLIPKASSQGSPSGESSKENKDTSQVQSEKSNNDPEVEKASVASQVASSPALSIPNVAPATEVSAAPTPISTPVDIAAPS